MIFLSKLNKIDYSKPFNIIIGITFCFTLLATFASTGYLTNSDDIYQKLYFYTAYFGNTFIYVFLIFMLFVYPLVKWTKFKKLSIFVGGLLSVFMMIFLYADVRVHELYHFHINLAMLDLFFNAKGEVISFSDNDWIRIVRLSLRMMLAGVLATYFGAVILTRIKFIKWIAILSFVLSFLTANLVYAFDYYLGTNYITEQANKVIFFKPLTMSSLLRKMGLKPVFDSDKVKLSSKNQFYYPKNTLSCPTNPAFLTSENKPYNIIFVLVDSLRFDVINEKTTPNLYNLAKENLYYTNHYSGGNATRTGVFSIFYGIPSYYWNQSIITSKEPALFEVMHKHNYDIQAFASANLYNPEFYRNVFVNIKGVRTESKCKGAADCDNDALKDFYHYLDKEDKNNPFFAFVFLDQLHSQRLTDDDLKLDLPFKPNLKEAEYLKLNANYDKKNYFELYNNVVFVIDKKIGQIVEKLKSKNLYDNSIIVFTSDHGDEFNDNNLNYCGHNSNFTDYQIKVPMIIKWPQKQNQIDELTTHYDVSVTLIKDYFNCTNNVSDYSFGRGLFSGESKNYFISGSYLENAIITKDQIAVIKGYGDIQYKDKHYKKLDNDKVDREVVLSAIKDFSFYVTKDSDTKK